MHASEMFIPPLMMPTMMSSLLALRSMFQASMRQRLEMRILESPVLADDAVRVFVSLVVLHFSGLERLDFCAGELFAAIARTVRRVLHGVKEVFLDFRKKVFFVDGG